MALENPFDVFDSRGAQISNQGAVESFQQKGFDQERPSKMFPSSATDWVVGTGVHDGLLTPWKPFTRYLGEAKLMVTSLRWSSYTFIFSGFPCQMEHVYSWW